jgi:hypothetical protein
MLKATGGTVLKEIHADFPVEMNSDRKEACIRMKDLSGDAEKDVLLSLTVPALDEPIQLWNALECSVQYVDTADGRAIMSAVSMALSRPQCHTQETPDAMVESHHCRLLTARAMEQAAKLAAASVPETVIKALLEETVTHLENSSSRRSEEGSQLVKHLLADLSLCLEHSSDPRTLEKWCSTKAFSHKYQVSTGSEYRNHFQVQLAEAARQEIGAWQPASQRNPRGRASRPNPTGRGGGGYVATQGQTATVSLNGGINAGSLRKGMRVVCPKSGRPGMVREVQSSKTGKHGHAKTFLTIVGDDGVERQMVLAALDDIQMA